MKRLLLPVIILLVMITFAYGGNKKTVYILPFVVELNGGNKDDSKKATDTFAEELKKLDLFQVVDRKKFEPALKDVIVYKSKKYDTQSLEKITEKYGKGVFLHVTILQEDDRITSTIYIYDPEKRLSTNTSNSNKTYNQSNDEIIKTDISLFISSIKNYRQSAVFSLLADSSDSKNNKYNLTKEEMLSLLKKYSYDAYSILKEVDSKDKTENLLQFLTFNYNMCDELSVTVHEFSHAYHKLTASYLINSNESIQVKNTETFPSNEIASVFPDGLRSGRFNTYIIPEDHNLSTMLTGIYAFLDEFVAYYHQTKLSYDLIQYYKNELFKYDPYIFNDCLGSINLQYYAYYEFKYYIYTYLLFAKENHPAVYKNIINNQNFILTFNKIDKLYSGLIEKTYLIEDDLEKFLKTKDCQYNKNRFFYVDKNYPIVLRFLEELKKDKYLKLEKAVFKTNIRL